MGQRLDWLKAILTRPLTLRNPIAYPPLCSNSKGEIIDPMLLQFDGFILNCDRKKGMTDKPRKFSSASSGFQFYFSEGHKNNVTPNDEAYGLMFRGNIKIGDKRFKNANALIILSEEVIG